MYIYICVYALYNDIDIDTFIYPSQPVAGRNGNNTMSPGRSPLHSERLECARRSPRATGMTGSGDRKSIGKSIRNPWVYPWNI